MTMLWRRCPGPTSASSRAPNVLQPPTTPCPSRNLYLGTWAPYEKSRISLSTPICYITWRNSCRMPSHTHGKMCAITMLLSWPTSNTPTLPGRIGRPYRNCGTPTPAPPLVPRHEVPKGSVLCLTLVRARHVLSGSRATAANRLPMTISFTSVLGAGNTLIAHISTRNRLAKLRPEKRQKTGEVNPLLPAGSHFYQCCWPCSCPHGPRTPGLPTWWHPRTRAAQTCQRPQPHSMSRPFAPARLAQRRARPWHGLTVQCSAQPGRPQLLWCPHTCQSPAPHFFLASQCWQVQWPRSHRFPGIRICIKLCSPLHAPACPDQPCLCHTSPHPRGSLCKHRTGLWHAARPIWMPPFHPPFSNQPLNDRPKETFWETPGHFRSLLSPWRFRQQWHPTRHVPKWTLQAALTQDLRCLIIQQGSGCLLWSVDLHRGYRQLRVCPLDWPLFGIHWAGRYYFDTAVPFGVRWGAMYMQRTSAAASAIARTEHIPTVPYIDDTASAQQPADAWAGMARFNALLHELGLQDVEKEKLPHTVMTWLGVNFDTVNMIMSVPLPKIADCLSTTCLWAQKLHATKSELTQYLGKLLHICECWTTLRLFVNRMLQTLRSVPEHGSIRLDPEFQADVQWILSYLLQYNGVQMIPDSPTLHVPLVINSCPTGGGGQFGRHLYFTQYPHFILQRTHGISDL